MFMRKFVALYPHDFHKKVLTLANLATLFSLWFVKKPRKRNVYV